MNGTVRYWRNLGQGTFDLPREMREAPAGLQLADPGVQLIDADGDGRIDLLVSTSALSGYFPMRLGVCGTSAPSIAIHLLPASIWKIRKSN